MGVFLRKRASLCRLRFACVWLSMILAMLRCSVAFSTIILDPGHGGVDYGTRHGRITEKNLALDVALRVERILVAKGLRTVMTRRDDRTVSLGARANLSKRYAAHQAIFVSIHFNSADREKARGVETFYYGKGGLALANRVHHFLAARAGTKNRGVKRKGYYVLHRTRCPAILIECGFISNGWERRRILNSDYRQRLAQSIAEGIVHYRTLSLRGQ